MQFFVKKTKTKGIGLIEILITTTIFLIVALAILTLYNSIINMIGNTKMRTVALTIALEKMEIIRNLSYEQVATQIGFVPPGPIPNSENLSRSGGNFTVSTSVTYINDPYDGTSPSSSPPDLYIWDYKRVEIQVSWTRKGTTKSVSLVTDVAPKGLEGTSSSKGGLWIKVFNAGGIGVDTAQVIVENNNLSPPYSLSSSTDTNGNLFVTDLEPDINGYKISVTKTNYSLDRTYSPADLLALGYANATPVAPYASVMVGQITEISFAIDQTSTLTIKTFYQAMPNNLKVNTDSDSNSHDNVSFTVDGADNSYFTWRDGRDGAPRIYSQKYNNSQVSQWSPDKKLVSAGNTNWSQAAMAPDGLSFYVTWQDDRNGNQDIYFNRYSSVDASPLWSGEKKVNTDVSSADQTRPSLTVGQNIFIAWTDNRNANFDIYAQRFDSSGNQLWPSDIKINTNTDSSDQKNSVISQDTTGNFYIAWLDNRAGNWDIYMQKYDANGIALWSTDIKVNSDSGNFDQNSPAIALDSLGYVYIVWSDDRRGNYDIYVAKFSQDGSRVTSDGWASGDLRINTDSGSALQTEPSLSFSGSNFYITWTDNRAGNNDIYLQKYTSSGTKLWDYDIKLNTDNTSASQELPFLKILTTGEALIAWTDNRGGNSDIYMTKYSEPNISPRGGVGLRIFGAKLIGNYLNPSPPPDTLPIYKYLKEAATDANGILALPLAGDPTTQVEWDNYNIEIKAPYTLSYSELPLPILLPPNSNLTITLFVNP